MDSIATIVEGDAHQTIARLKDPIDVLFVDADKEDYLGSLAGMHTYTRQD